MPFTAEEFHDLVRLVEVHPELTDDVSELKEMHLEMNYRFKGPAYFCRMIRRPHVLTSHEVTTLIEDAGERGLLSDADADDLYEADLRVRGWLVEDRATESAFSYSQYPESGHALLLQLVKPEEIS